ncbi:unnamed protein product [Closterium sp. NIES-65]|nr:unnamed protein product [Closterium sp. NIES-65]
MPPGESPRSFRHPPSRNGSAGGDMSSEPPPFSEHNPYQPHLPHYATNARQPSSLRFSFDNKCALGARQEDSGEGPAGNAETARRVGGGVDGEGGWGEDGEAAQRRHNNTGAYPAQGFGGSFGGSGGPQPAGLYQAQFYGEFRQQGNLRNQNGGNWRGGEGGLVREVSVLPEPPSTASEEAADWAAAAAAAAARQAWEHVGTVPVATGTVPVAGGEERSTLNDYAMVPSAGGGAMGGGGGGTGRGGVRVTGVGQRFVAQSNRDFAAAEAAAATAAVAAARAAAEEAAVPDAPPPAASGEISKYEEPSSSLQISAGGNGGTRGENAGMGAAENTGQQQRFSVRGGPGGDAVGAGAGGYVGGGVRMSMGGGGFGPFGLRPKRPEVSGDVASIWLNRWLRPPTAAAGGGGVGAGAGVAQENPLSLPVSGEFPGGGSVSALAAAVAEAEAARRRFERGRVAMQSWKSKSRPAIAHTGAAAGAGEGAAAAAGGVVGEGMARDSSALRVAAIENDVAAWSALLAERGGGGGRGGGGRGGGGAAVAAASDAGSSGSHEQQAHQTLQQHELEIQSHRDQQRAAAGSALFAPHSSLHSQQNLHALSIHPPSHSHSRSSATRSFGGSSSHSPAPPSPPVRGAGPEGLERVAEGGIGAEGGVRGGGGGARGFGAFGSGFGGVGRGSGGGRLGALRSGMVEAGRGRGGGGGGQGGRGGAGGGGGASEAASGGPVFVNTRRTEEYQKLHQSSSTLKPPGHPPVSPSGFAAFGMRVSAAESVSGKLRSLRAGGLSPAAAGPGGAGAKPGVARAGSGFSLSAAAAADALTNAAAAAAGLGPAGAASNVDAAVTAAGRRLTRVGSEGARATGATLPRLGSGGGGGGGGGGGFTWIQGGFVRREGSASPAASAGSGGAAAVAAGGGNSADSGGGGNMGYDFGYDMG